jgi:Ser/Thr protein kinase RdoA (MazF antagonist)
MGSKVDQIDAVALRTSLDGVVRAALERYDFSPEATVTLVNVSENSTFRVDDPESGRRAALRVSRPDYHSKEAIESELAWMAALREAGIVDPAVPIAARDGTLVTAVEVDTGPPRHVVLFDWISGEEPGADGDDLVPKFRLLGTLAAGMVLHAISWRRPPWFTRYTIDYEVALGPNALWGCWQDSLGMGREELDILTRVDAEILRRLTEYGKAPERFGLAHSDLRLANLLVAGDRIHVIDFDDCGTTWYMYDFATAVSFIEDDPRVPELMAAWVDGYNDRRPLSRADEEIIPTLVMFRRMLLVGWVGSHHEYAAEAAELGAGYTAGTCELAEAYLSGTYLR